MVRGQTPSTAIHLPVFCVAPHNVGSGVVNRLLSAVTIRGSQQGSSVDEDQRHQFEEFVQVVEPGLRRALVSVYGFERGREATAEALAWSWEHWEKARTLDHPIAYLVRVGQSKSRSRKVPVTFDRAEQPESSFEPSLGPSLASLTERQRMAVVLVHGFGWTLREVADLMEIKVTSVQTHLERGLRNLRAMMEVSDHA